MLFEHLHSSRVRMQHVTPEQLRAVNAQTGRATAELADLRPSVVATACLVAIMAQGPGHHCVMQAEIESILEQERAPAPVVSSAGALVDALHALRARRIGIVAPYLKELTRLVADYIEDAGIEVGDAVSLEVSDNQAVAATAATWAILRALELEPVAPGAGALLGPAPKAVAPPPS